MPATLIDGKAFAAKLSATVAEAVAALKTQGIKPGLATVLVGDDPASSVYVASKGRETLAAGMASFSHRLPADTREADLLALLGQLNADDAVDGILVQLPLPKHLDTARIIAAIDPAKDVDGLTIGNAGRLASGLAGLVPCTPYGSM
ncbi:bifunctional methylenetetrahydrofolate dehydrogenase/methenyltetrahydrofolate cyclohydrolase, partial [Mycobacterium tuberculosis]|nr:bifunctional methylenetetrahydrofolate dehydrogenase/methenyltetrahydrofolate cyclohydrolase [Mycobacterium tuberculosis]